MSTLALDRGLGRSRTKLGQRLRHGLSAWWHERRRRRSITDIAQLDDYLLRDIGISRADIQDALDNRRSSVLFEPFRNDGR